MAEVSLVRFAGVALEVAETILPDYRGKFSKARLYSAAALGQPPTDALRGLDLA